MADIIDEIKKLAKEDKLVIGTERAVKMMRLGKLKQVFITSNCPEEVKKDIEYYAKLGYVKAIELSIPNEELGVVCRKPFMISVLGVKK